MKIEYIYEAGVFGSYKKANAQSNIDNAKKELTRDAALHVLESRCDELAELYFDMLNEVSLEASIICKDADKEKSNLVELSKYLANKYFMRSRKKEMQLNLIKNMYCNKLAIEYMVSKGCFILPLVDIKHGWTFFNDAKEIIPYKNMTKTVAEAAEKIIKSHLSKFPSYAFNIPNKVKIVILSNVFFYDLNSSYHSKAEENFFSSLDIDIINNSVDFKYPVGQGSSCLNYILNTFNSLLCNNLNVKPIKSDEHIWKTMAEPSPWMFNKIELTSITTNLSTVSADNFYGIKLLKFAIDKGVLLRENGHCIKICIDNVIKNMQYVKKLKQEISNNGLDKYVSYYFNDMHNYTETFINIGKELSTEQTEQEGIIIDSLKTRVYEFDYKDVAEVDSTTEKMVKACDKFLTNADDSTKQSIKQMIEFKLKTYLPDLMSKISTSKPNCISSSNKILLCDYYKYSENINPNIANSNIRVVIDPNKIQFNKKGNLVFCVGFDFKLPVRGVNTKYNNKASSRQTSGKNYEYINGKQIKIEITL